MGVDLRGVHVVVAEQLLNGADVAPIFEKMRREGVAEDVGCASRAPSCRSVSHRRDGGGGPRPPEDNPAAARSAEMMPSSTSARTCSTGRSAGSPQPPAPGVTMLTRSPGARRKPQPFEGSARSSGRPGLSRMAPRPPGLPPPSPQGQALVPDVADALPGAVGVVGDVGYEAERFASGEDGPTRLMSGRCVPPPA